jgi:hypothetical protein
MGLPGCGKGSCPDCLVAVLLLQQPLFQPQGIEFFPVGLHRLLLLQDGLFRSLLPLHGGLLRSSLVGNGLLQVPVFSFNRLQQFIEVRQILRQVDGAEVTALPLLQGGNFLPGSGKPLATCLLAGQESLLRLLTKTSGNFVTLLIDLL